MPILPSIQDLQAFEAAARRLSFVQAAAELNITPGAVSRRLQNLENHLGRALFRRDHRQVSLTAAGRDYLTDIADALTRIELADARLRDDRAPRAVSICVYPTFAFRWLIPRWGRFYDAHPDIDVQLTTSLNPVDFARDDYDLVIKVAEIPPDGGLLIYEKLLDVTLYPVCSPALARGLASPRDVKGQILLHGDPRPDDWARWLDLAGLGGDGGIDAAQGLHFDSSNLAFQAAAEGLGLAIGIDCLVREDLRQGRLVRPFGPVRQSASPFVLVYPKAKRGHKPLKLFRDWLLAEAAADGGDGPGQSVAAVAKGRPAPAGGC